MPTAAETIAGVEESLATLRRSHVDVLLAHDIQHLGEGVKAVESILQRGGMVEGFRQLQREGTGAIHRGERTACRGNGSGTDGRI